MSDELKAMLLVYEKHAECHPLNCGVGDSPETVNECMGVDDMRPLLTLLAEIRLEIKGFERAEFEGLYSRLRDIHILLNEPEES